MSEQDSDSYGAHVEKLKVLCRICGCNLKKEISKYEKESFKEELLTVFGINIEEDTTDVHPGLICKNDARSLYRFRSTGLFPAFSAAKKFMPHLEGCEICRPYKPQVTRKKKKKSIEPSSSSLAGISENFEVPLQTSRRRSIVASIETYLSTISKDEKTSFFTDMLQLLSEEELGLLSNCLGKQTCSSIRKDADTFSLMYKDADAISNFSLTHWLKQRNTSVLEYLAGIRQNNLDPEFTSINSDDLLILTRALEHIYHVCCPNMISPLSFLLNVTSYAITGSKTAVDMFGNASPSGHYKSVTNWLKDQGNQETICPKKDLMNVFDNEQVIGRKNAIRPGNKVKISIITNKGFVVLDQCDDELQNLQFKEDLKPLQSFNISMIKGEEKKKEYRKAVAEMIDQESAHFVAFEKDHYEQLYYFIDNAIHEVQSEQKSDEGAIHDVIDDCLQKEATDSTTITCANCGTVNRKRKLVCDGCNERDGLRKAKELKKQGTVDEAYKSKQPTNIIITFEDQDESTNVRESSRYDHIKSNHKAKHEIVLTDPVFCNPNSFETVARVLRKIGLENGIARYGGTHRHWTFICCDGLPYMICKKLKEEAVVCTIEGCKQKFLSKDTFLAHAQHFHPDSEDYTFIHEFDWIYLRIGSGHYEMNLIKSFFELNWTPFLETLCEKMGFTSESAKNYAKACKDLHKSWNILLVFHLASLRELVVPFVRHCLLTGENADAKSFLKYSSNLYSATNLPNHHYLLDQVCRFSQGIINFRMAVRRNNAELLKSAKFMTKELFHGRNHPKYSTIELFETIQDFMMPDPVRRLNDSYASITTSGNMSLGEDFDFILEEKNRQLKSWIPKGVPSDEIWQTVCRNNKILEKIKRNSLSLFGIKQTSGAEKNADLDEAITAFRMILRKDKYIEKVGDHTSLSGLALDESLVDFVGEATRRRICSIKSNFLGASLENDKHPIPITPNERQHLESNAKKTVTTITQEIEEILQNIEDPLQYDYHLKMYREEIKGKNKATAIKFLEELQEAIVLPMQEALVTQDEEV